MPEDILDNVKELLNKDIGDKKVLEQIKRAAENNEAISNYERNYVRKLIEDLRKPPEPKVETPPEKLTEILSPQEQVPTTSPQLHTSTIVTHKPKDKTNIKVIIGGAAIVLAIIAAVLLGTNEIDVGSNNPVIVPSSGLLDLDQSSYNEGDIISISGKSKKSLGNTINLSIENPNGELIWAEDIKIKESGEYSTLAIAGGSGWENSGTYTLKMKHGNENEQITFSFKR
ncbi:MAG TPA: hypothetical protein VFG25_01085 [Nitrosopumilaceae archaeon]|nr:hypothetical protein [Nitrosopumilaceae archaeon]